MRLAFTPKFATYLMGSLTHLMLSTYPNITMTINVLAQVDIEEGLTHDCFGLGISPCPPESAEISYNSFGEEHLNCFVSANHPCADLLSIDSEMLSTLKFALFDRSFAIRLFIDKHIRANRLQAKISVESNSVDKLVSLIRYGAMRRSYRELLKQDCWDTIDTATPLIPTRPSAGG